MKSLLTDLRAALRVFVRQPRYALLSAGGYALGIGMVTAVFGLVDDVVLDPLPWPAADRVVGLWESYPPMGTDRVPAAPAKIAAWRAETDVLTSVKAWRLDEYDLTGLGDPERLPVGRVEPGTLELLGVAPLHGRAFAEGEGVRGRDGVAVLSWHLWSERFGSDPTVLGRTLTLDGQPHEVVGVLPRGAHFPEGADVLVPLVIDEWRSRVAHAYRAVGRMAPGVDAGAVEARLDAVAARLEAEHPDTDRDWGVTVVPLRDQLLGDVTPIFLLLLGAGAVVFLVACANAASLLTVRVTGRRRELAVRTSLGASRGRLVSHLAAESLVIALAGGVVGLVLARLAGAGLLALTPGDLPATVDAAFDPTVFGFALALTVVAGLVFGLLPALRSTRDDPMAGIRSGTATAGRGRARLRNAVVGAEVAMAALLLAGNALFLRSAVELSAVDPGFEPAGVLTAHLSPPRDRYPTEADRRALYDAVLENASAAPGVVSAALVNHVPLGGRSDNFRFRVEGRPAPTVADLDVAPIRSVTPGFFETMGTGLLRGRALEAADGPDAERVALVSREMARRHWPDGDALGARIGFDGEDGPWVRIVGVVEDVRHGSLTEPPEPQIYVPLAQQTWPAVSVVVRGDGDPLALLPGLRDAVGRADPLLPLSRVRTGPDLVESAGARWRFQALLVAVFALTALILAVTGVYGLLAYVVGERTRELAVRMALGARAGDLRRMVTGNALLLAGVGAAVGLGAAWALADVIRGMLYAVEPTDPWSFAVAGAVVVLVALGAAWAPARRAGRVDPSEALRET